MALLNRWSGADAPEGKCWRVKPAEDLVWFRREILADPAWSGLDIEAALGRWDEFIEQTMRSGKTGKFPVQFKSALRSHLLIEQSRQQRVIPHRGYGGHIDECKGTVWRYYPSEFPEPRVVSYAEHLRLREPSGEAPWPREAFDTAVHDNGLEPVD